MDESLVILEAKNMYHIYESLSLEGNVVALRGLNVRINEGCLLYTSDAADE